MVLDVRESCITVEEGAKSGLGASAVDGEGRTVTGSHQLGELSDDWIVREQHGQGIE